MLFGCCCSRCCLCCSCCCPRLCRSYCCRHHWCCCSNLFIRLLARSPPPAPTPTKKNSFWKRNKFGTWDRCCKTLQPGTKNFLREVQLFPSAIFFHWTLGWEKFRQLQSCWSNSFYFVFRIQKMVSNHVSDSNLRHVPFTSTIVSEANCPFWNCQNVFGWNFLVEYWRLNQILT